MTRRALVLSLLASAASAFNVAPFNAAGAHHAVSRASLIQAVTKGPPEKIAAQDETQQVTDGGVAPQWQTTVDGIKYVDDCVGAGPAPSADSVISVHYTISFAESGSMLGTSRGRWPLTFAPGKHAVPIFTEGIEGMRVGGRRRLTVPANKIPPSQIRNVPQDQAGEALRFDIELVGIESGVKAIIPTLLPPGDRRVTILRVLFALSFVPYFMPENVKPELYKAPPPEEIMERRHDAANDRFLGGDTGSLDLLFP